MNPPSATQTLGALQSNKYHQQNQAYFSNLYYLSHEEGGLVLIQPPGSHPAKIREAAGAGSDIAPWEPRFGVPPLQSPQLSLGLAKAKFHTQSLPIPHLWHSWAEPELWVIRHPGSLIAAAHEKDGVAEITV